MTEVAAFPAQSDRQADGGWLRPFDRRRKLSAEPVPGGGGVELDRLVTAARGGDRDALDGLIRATYADTYTLAFRLTGRDEDARDVVQETYLRAYRGLRRFRGDAQFTTWLFRITANCASSLLAKRSRQRTEVLDETAPLVDLRPGVDPESSLAARQDRAVVAAALGRLPWRLRQVIVLRDIYDLPHAVIAEELGISEAAAKVRVHRARRRLREILDGAGPGVAGSEDGHPVVAEEVYARARAS